MRHFLMSRVPASVIAALLLAGVLASGAAAWDTSCSGKVCNYRDQNFGVPLAAMAGSDSSYVGDVYPNTTESLNDTVSSVANTYSSRDVIWYHDTSASGSSFCLNPGIGALWVGLLNNDRFSSHSVAVDNNAC